MRRTKEWWSVLTKGERVWLVFSEYGNNMIGGGSAYLPVGYSDCNLCSTPTSHGLCSDCSLEQHRIIYKAERMIIRLRAVQLMQDISNMGIEPPCRKQAVKMARRMMCRWEAGRWGRVTNDKIQVAYHPLQPASKLILM